MVAAERISWRRVPTVGRCFGRLKSGEDDGRYINTVTLLFFRSVQQDDRLDGPAVSSIAV